MRRTKSTILKIKTVYTNEKNHLLHLPKIKTTSSELKYGLIDNYELWAWVYDQVCTDNPPIAPIPKAGLFEKPIQQLFSIE